MMTWQVRLAEGIDGFSDMSLESRHTFCMAPLDARDGLHATLLFKWAKDFTKSGVVKVRYAPPKRAPASHVEMQQLESYFRALDGYIWLAQRFPMAFSQADKVREYSEMTAEMIEQALDDPPLPPDKHGKTPDKKKDGMKARGPGGGKRPSNGRGRRRR